MTENLILIAGSGLGCGILMVIGWALLAHPELPVAERLGLGVLAGGIVWGGINRATDRPFDLGDLLLLIGILLVLWRYFKRNPEIKGVK